MSEETVKTEEGVSILDRETYCGRLGHFIPYSYCLKPAQEDPCFKIMDCWWETFDIRTYLEKRLSETEFKSVTEAKPPDKILSILELIEQAKQRQ